MALKFGTSGIRGLNTEFTSKTVESYLNAFLRHAKTKTQIQKIAIAGDLRESTPGIMYMIEDLLKKESVEIINCGEIPTPALAFFCQTKKMPGIMVTGSHIPADRNGIKFYWPWGEILKEDELAISRYFDEINKKSSQTLKTNVNEGEKAQEIFVERYVNYFSTYKEFLKNIKVIIYQQSTVTRDLWRQILIPLGVEVFEIAKASVFNPVDTETNEAVVNLKKALTESQTPKDFFAIISADGDGDRPLLVDEKLNLVRGDTIGLLTAKFLKADEVVTPVSSTTAIEKSEFFKKVVRTKIGSPFVIEAMMSSQAQITVGFEANGGVLLGSDVTNGKNKLDRLPTRDSILPVLSVLIEASKNHKTISQLVESLPQRFTSSDVLRNFPTDKSQEIYNKALEDQSFQKKIGKIQKIDKIDGLRLTLEGDQIIHFRPSGNAPEFRCYTEAESSQKAETLLKNGIEWVRGNIGAL